MSQNSEQAFASHVLASIRKDLEFLKQQNYVSQEAYNDILRILPQQAVRSGGGYGQQTSIPSPVSAHNAPPPVYQASPKTPNTLGTAEALYDFTGQNPQDLSFRRGDIIHIVEFVNDDWWRGSLNGQTGLFPSNYVQKQSQVPPQREEKNTPPPPPARAQPTPQPPAQQPPAQQPYQTPPPQAGYGGGYPPAPPAQAPAGYGAPPTMYPSPPVAAPAPQYNYATPPPAAPAAPVVVQEGGGEHGSGKWSGMIKNTASNVGNAATWGFGATLGSQAASSLF